PPGRHPVPDPRARDDRFRAPGGDPARHHPLRSRDDGLLRGVGRDLRDRRRAARRSHPGPGLHRRHLGPRPLRDHAHADEGRPSPTRVSDAGRPGGIGRRRAGHHDRAGRWLNRLGSRRHSSSDGDRRPRQGALPAVRPAFRDRQRAATGGGDRWRLPGQARRGRAVVTNSLDAYLILSGLVFAIGTFGFLARRNAISMLMSIELMLNGVNLSIKLWEWIPAGKACHVDVGFTVDNLTAVLLIVVTTIGMLVHVYSIGYMAHDPGYWRFFAYLNLFMFSMLVLVLASSFLVVFVAWELVGLSSYLLIGFWYRRRSAALAAKKAFIVNRIGDVGFALGIMAIFV